VDCPDDEELAALLSQAVDAPRRAAIIDHAAGCAACHLVVAELATQRSVDVALETASSDEDPGADVRRAVATALLERDRRTKIGRYHLLEIVGAGGMGVVWGAWDPELARRVALKLVHPRLGAARDRILAEGQALGKLSHPNVVPVYDVGVIDEQVYLVMEWVQGTTLRAYAASGCTRRELIDAYRQAGEGLAAAHRAGLVHRDFKPDNAIRGDDGRVRVLDFGLARSDDEAREPVRRLAGTPRYMPPEQAAGGVVTPASDQFAFALSLQEAVSQQLRAPRTSPDARAPDERPGHARLPDASRAPSAELPSWLAAIVARGTAPEPADRYPSMDALLRALARDPAWRWRRRGVALAALAVAGAAFVVGRAHTDAPATCVGSATEIARSWSPHARAAVLGHLQGLGAFGAGEAARLGAELDAYSAAWAGEHRRACLAHARGELPATLYERRIACLARGQAALTAVGELMREVRPDGLPAALVAARSLPSAAGCTAVDTSGVAPPPDALAARVAAVAPAVERARVLAVAARPDAIAAARTTVAAAEQVGYAPLTARALLAQGRAETELDAAEPAARTSFERALDLALRSADDVLAVEIYARLIWVVARYRGDVVESWPVMEAIAGRTGALGAFGRALLYNNKAVARMAASDRPGARALLLRALAAAPRQLGDDLELVNIGQNLALATDDPAEREARSRGVVRELDALLGPAHPNTLGARLFAAILTRNPDTAAADLAAACDGYQRWHPQLTAVIAECAFERAWLADERGDRSQAIAAMQLAARDPLSPTERGKGTIAGAYVAIAGAPVQGPDTATPATRATGDTRDATPAARVAVRELEALAAALATTDNWWSHGEAADAYVTAARGHDRTGHPADAERDLRAALALLEQVGQPMYERRLARVRAELAHRLAARAPAAAAPLARAALAWYRAAGGYDAQLAALAAIAN
jgi:hypothetical protein